jgi:ketosteroid isomerase-like protein
MADDDANLELIKRVTFLWVSRNYDAILPFVAYDAVYVIARGSLEKFNPHLFGTFRGKDAIKGWYQSNAEAAAAAVGAIRPFCLIGDTGEFISAGNHVINYGTMTATSTEPACDWTAIWTVRDGLIKNCTMVMDTATTFLKLKHANPSLVLE